LGNNSFKNCDYYLGDDEVQKDKEPTRGFLGEREKNERNEHNNWKNGVNHPEYFKKVVE